MKPQTEQTVVGIVVLVAAAILLMALISIQGTLGQSPKTYHATFPFGGGLERGAAVRYLGGPKVGRVEGLLVSSQDPSHIDITFSVQQDTIVKTDTRVKIMSLSPLGENHLEIVPGSVSAPPAPNGYQLASEKYVDFNVITQEISDIGPQARQLMGTLNDRAMELRETVTRINDLLNAQNRSNLSGILSETHGMITETRPQVRTALQHVNDVGGKLGPLVDDFHQTADQANKVLSQVDAMVGEDRPEVRQALVQLRGTLRSLNELTGKLNQTLDVNSENIDQLLDNMLHVTENLKEFTETIKMRPYTLIRASTPPEHAPGGSSEAQ
jgi:phospholipid/cholesterol/gamma-HCH transport system substrate-binding protein